MKLFVLLFLPVFSLAQDKGGYASIRAGVSIYKGQQVAMGRVSVGVSKNNTFGIGGGFGFIKFDKVYIPLTVDMSFFGKPGKVSPVIIGQAGYGIYNYTSSYVTQRGGFTGGFNAGIAFPGGGTRKIFVTGGLGIYSFTTTVRQGSNTSVNSNSISRLDITAGFKF